MKTELELCHNMDSNLLQLDLMAIVALYSIALQKMPLIQLSRVRFLLSRCQLLNIFVITLVLAAAVVAQSVKHPGLRSLKRGATELP